MRYYRGSAVIFPLAVALTVVIDGRPLRAYNAPYVKQGRVMAPLNPYVTAIARSIGYDGKALIIRLGDRFTQVPMASAPAPSRYDRLYVALAPIARTLGARVWFDVHTHTLYVQTPLRALATPTPFNPAVPEAPPRAVFTPSPAPQPRPTVSGTPLPRRTPIPVRARPSPVPVSRAENCACALRNGAEYARFER